MDRPDVQVGGDDGVDPGGQFGLEHLEVEGARAVAQVEDDAHVAQAQERVGGPSLGDQAGGHAGGAVGEDVPLLQERGDLGQTGRPVADVDHEGTAQPVGHAAGAAQGFDPVGADGVPVDPGLDPADQVGGGGCDRHGGVDVEVLQHVVFAGPTDQTGARHVDQGVHAQRGGVDGRTA